MTEEYRPGAMAPDQLPTFAADNGLHMQSDLNPDSSMLWIDVETTGFQKDPKAFTLEVGALVTNSAGDLMPEGAWTSLVLMDGAGDHLTRAKWLGLDDFVVDMHTKSGLFGDLEGEVSGGRAKQYHPDEVAESFLSWTDDLGLSGDTFPMCGSTVEFDRTFLRRDLPLVEQFFMYRTINISSIKEVCKLVNPRVAAYRKSLAEDEVKQHRPLRDLAASIREWQFYRDNFIWVDESSQDDYLHVATRPGGPIL